MSIAEPTTSPAWTLNDIIKQMKKTYKKQVMGLENLNIYLDSGGYQIILGHITKNRIKEFIETYHFIFKRYLKDIDFIFTLDINNLKFSPNDIETLNNTSIKTSIEFIKKYPIAKNKQIFVVQSRTPEMLNIWKDLMDKNEVYNHYFRYSFGGLVGLKSETRATFNHFTPMTIWLMAYLKKNNGKITHLHMLGQSSRVAIITGSILEKLFKIDITMDSSEIIRFSPISGKVPAIHNCENDFKVLRNLDDLCTLMDYHSDECELLKIDAIKAELANGNVSNQTFIEIISMNIENTIAFADYFLKEKNVDDILNYKKEDFEKFHEVFKIGRLSQEMENNMFLIKQLLPYYEENRFDELHTIVINIINNYYTTKIKNGRI